MVIQYVGNVLVRHDGKYTLTNHLWSSELEVIVKAIRSNIYIFA